MITRRTTARDLAADELTLEGAFEIEGFLTFRSLSDQGWLAADDEKAEPVVMLTQSVELIDALQANVFVLCGGPFLYLNQAKVVGSLTSDRDRYLLRDISTIEIWDNNKLIALTLEN